MFRLFGEQTPLDRFPQKIGTIVWVDDIIIQSNIGYNIFRGFKSTGRQFFHFPIDLAGHRYNSAAATASLCAACDYEGSVNFITLRLFAPSSECIIVYKYMYTLWGIFIFPTNHCEHMHTSLWGKYIFPTEPCCTNGFSPQGSFPTRSVCGYRCVCACVCKLLPRHFLLVQPSGSTVGLHGRIKTKTLDNGISHKG